MNIYQHRNALQLHAWYCTMHTPRFDYARCVTNNETRTMYLRSFSQHEHAPVSRGERPWLVNQSRDGTWGTHGRDVAMVMGAFWAHAALNKKQTGTVAASNSSHPPSSLSSRSSYCPTFPSLATHLRCHPLSLKASRLRSSHNSINPAQPTLCPPEKNEGFRIFSRAYSLLGHLSRRPRSRRSAPSSWTLCDPCYSYLNR